MSALKTVLENLDDLPDALKEFYREDKDKGFVLDLEEFDSHPSVLGLKNTVAGLRSDRKKQGDELKLLRERLAVVPEDFNADQYAELKAKLEEYEADPSKNKTADDKANKELVAARKMLEQKIASMEKTFAAELEKQKAITAKKDAFIQNLLKDEQLTKSLIENNVDKSFLRAAHALIKPLIKIKETDDGGYEPYIETDIAASDIPTFVRDWVASDEGKPFVPQAKGGDAGGSSKSAGRQFNGDNPWDKKAGTWNVTKQMQIIKADRSRAEKLARAAGVKLPPPLPAV